MYVDLGYSFDTAYDGKAENRHDRSQSYVVLWRLTYAS